MVILVILVIFDVVGDVADWNRWYSCWSLPSGHWSSWVFFTMLPITPQSVKSCPPHISAANPYMVVRSSFRLVHLSAKSSWYVFIYGHTSCLSKESELLSASEFQTCRILCSGGNGGWSWSRFHRRWWKSSVCNESKTVHRGSMQCRGSVSGVPLYKRSIRQCLFTNCNVYKGGWEE